MRIRISAALILLALPLAPGVLLAQGTGRYENQDLKLTFEGIYGWQSTFAAGSGGWAELARYRDEALDATVRVLVTSNPYASAAEMHEAIAKEFAAGDEPKAGQPAFKEITVTDCTMRRGAKLPGVDAAGYRVSIDEAGKKREDRILVRTFFSPERLFRVFCEARRSRASRVEDLFVRALDGLTVEAGSVKAARVFAIRSAGGRYTVAVPEGFQPIVPGKDDPEDLRFEKPRRNIKVQIFAQVWEGGVEDQLDALFNEFGSDIRLESDEVQVFGNPGYLCRIERGDMITLVSGTVKDQRSIHVHTTFHKDREVEAKADHAAFLAGIELEG